MFTYIHKDDLKVTYPWSPHEHLIIPLSISLNVCVTNITFLKGVKTVYIMIWTEFKIHMTVIHNGFWQILKPRIFGNTRKTETKINRNHFEFINARKGLIVSNSEDGTVYSRQSGHHKLATNSVGAGTVYFRQPGHHKLATNSVGGWYSIPSTTRTRQISDEHCWRPVQYTLDNPDTTN